MAQKIEAPPQQGGKERERYVEKETERERESGRAGQNRAKQSNNLLIPFLLSTTARRVSEARLSDNDNDNRNDNRNATTTNRRRRRRRRRRSSHFHRRGAAAATAAAHSSRL